MKLKKACLNFAKTHYEAIMAWLIIACSSFLVFYRLGSIPAGLSTTEIASVQSSTAIDPFNTPINLPWLIWQGLFVRAFGLSTLSVRLPAAILGLIAGIILWRLLRRFTSTSGTLLGLAISLTSVVYIGASRAGTPAIMTILLLELALLFGLRARQREHGLLAASCCLGLLCLMDFGLAIVLALGLVALLHPQIRLWLLDDRHRLINLGAVCGITALGLIGFELISVLVGHGLKLGAVGVPSLTNLGQFIDVSLGVHYKLSGGLVSPLFSIVGATLAAIGLVSILRECHLCIRAYVICAMLIASSIVGLFAPTAGYLLFLPLSLLTSVAIAELVDNWYKLFPKSPYARGFAVAPLILLVVTLSCTNAARYFNGILYSSTIANKFDYTMTALDELKADKETRYIVIFDTDKVNLYKWLSADNLEFNDQMPKRGNIVVFSDATPPSGAKLKRVITNKLKSNNVVARVYKLN